MIITIFSIYVDHKIKVYFKIIKNTFSLLNMIVLKVDTITFMCKRDYLPATFNYNNYYFYFVTLIKTVLIN